MARWLWLSATSRSTAVSSSTLQFQVNPTTVGRRSQAVELYDGSRLVARVNRTVTVYP